MRPDAATRFVSKIKEKQQTLEMNDCAFAEYLGVTRQLWQMTRSDPPRKRLGPRIAVAALNAFPDLHDYFLAWSMTWRHGRSAAKKARADDDSASALAASVASAGVTPASAMMLAEVR